jgi:AcrR family transcriptional regulator
MGTRRGRKDAYHHGDLRRALIAAALEAIAESGPEKFSLREAARRAGVSAGAPYRHFKDRDELIAAVAAECAERLGAAVDAATSAAGSDPLAIYRASGVAYVRFAVENPAHFRVMSHPGVAARTPPATRRHIAGWDADMRALLIEAQRTGKLISIDLDDLTLAARSLTHGLASLIVDGAEGLRGLDADRAARLALNVTGILGLGLLPRKSVGRAGR